MLRNGVSYRWFALLLGASLVIAACRAGDFVAQYTSRPTATAPQARPTKTETPGETATETEVPTDSEAPTETDVPTDTEAPTETEVPTDTEAPAPAEVSVPTDTDEPTETEVPTREFQYQISYSWCGPNQGITFVEGTIYQDGDTQDGLLVRLAVNPGGDPIVNDYKAGTDPSKPGGYTQIIGANGPRGGLWYLWVVDPDTKQRISDIATVKTDAKYVEDTDQSSGSCQSAVVDFANDLSTAPIPTGAPTAAPSSSPAPTSTGAPATGTLTRTATVTVTGTPPTNTPTPSRTPSSTAKPSATRRPTRTPTP
jgi:hypothetical protein